MRKIKLLAIALVLALAGFVYAMGQAGNTKNACSMDKGGCCAECCKAADSCCKTGDSKQAHKTETGCASCECCKGEGSCCKMDKSGKMQMKEGASCEMSKDGKACCGDSCCSKDKGKTS